MTDSYLKFQFSLMTYLQLQYLQKFMILWLHTQHDNEVFLITATQG